MGQKRKSSKKSKRKSEKKSERKSHDESAAQPSWWAGKAPIVQFVVGLLVLMGVFSAAFNIWLIHMDSFQAYLNINARVCAFVLDAFGETPQVDGTVIFTPRFALEIKTGCDAIQASVFFGLLVLVSPLGSSLRSRWPAVVLGVGFLLCLNLGRIISLYYTGVFYPKMFETMHVEVWQAVFIFLPIMMWLGWVSRSRRRALPHAEVTS